MGNSLTVARAMKKPETHTHFFRIPSHFNALREDILPKLINDKLQHIAEEHRNIRILSAGCSSGQEPYSIAMCLVDNLVLPDMCNVEIIAYDTDQDVLMAAKEAVYSEFDVRHIEEGYKERFFINKNGMCHLKDSIRGMVNILRLDMFDNDMLGEFDIIFCRNVLIYYGEDAVREIIGKFAGILKPGGYLFTGHSETLFGMTEELEFVDLGDGFAYRKKAAKIAGKISVPCNEEEPVKDVKNMPRGSSQNDILEIALRFLGNKDYSPLARICRSSLKEYPLFCELYYFLGLIYRTEGKYDASFLELKRALYLDKDFALAYYRLAQNYEESGENAQALKQYSNAVKALESKRENRMLDKNNEFTKELLMEMCREKLKRG